jgi:hypothetical protein
MPMVKRSGKTPTPTRITIVVVGKRGPDRWSLSVLSSWRAASAAACVANVCGGMTQIFRLYGLV